MRDRTIDIAKGIAIIMVVIGHISLTPKGMEVWLYTFHIPLFFMCSGMVFSPKKYETINALIRRKIQTLVMPYFSLGVSLWLFKNTYYALFNHFFEGNYDVNWNFGEALLGLVLGYRLHHYYFSLWFLCALFVGEVVLYVLTHNYKRSIHFIPVASIITILLQWLVFKYVNGFLWSIDLVPCAVSFLLLGYYASQITTELVKASKWPFIVLLLMVNVFFGAINYRLYGMTDLYYCKMGNPILLMISASAGSLGIIMICKRMKYSLLLEYFGRNSLIVYAYNNVFTIPVAKDLVFGLTKFSKMLQDETLQWVAVCVATGVISCIMIEIINRYIPFIIGKKGGIIHA